MTEDFYDLLDVSSNASQDEIKDAYREKVRLYHPDLNDDDRARAQFTAITKANEILTDPVERKAYDRLGHETYVSKRTSGIPSPDVWRTSDDQSEDVGSSGDTDGDTASQPDDSETDTSTGSSTASASSSRSESRSKSATSSRTTSVAESASGSTSTSDDSGGRTRTRTHSHTASGPRSESRSDSSSRSTNESETGSGSSGSGTDAESETKSAAASSSSASATGSRSRETSRSHSSGSSNESGSTTASDAGTSRARTSRARSRTRSNRTSTKRTDAGKSTDTSRSTTASASTGATASAATSSATGSATGSRTTAGAAGGANAATDTTGTTETPSAGSESTATGNHDPEDAGPAEAIFGWWRRRNVAMPLLWCSLLAYLVGLGHYALEQTQALGALWAELTASGADVGQLRAVLTGDRHGLEPAAAFVAEFDAPTALGAVAALEWYVVVGVVLGAAIALVGVGRLAWQETVHGSITMGETVVLAVALALAAGLTGGPLLAGTILLPFCFGVVVHHTRRLPGWTPSYLYVLPVLGPAIGVGLGVAGYATLPLEAVTLAVLPIVGGLWLPLRATIRKRFGR